MNWDNLNRLSLILLAVACLNGCITPYVNTGAGAGGVIAAVDPTGVTLTPEGYRLYLHEGVPADLFTGVTAVSESSKPLAGVAVPLHPHLSNLAWHQAQTIRLRYLNP